MKTSEYANSESRMSRQCLQEETGLEEFEGRSLLADQLAQEMNTSHPPAAQRLYQTNLNSSVEGSDYIHNADLPQTHDEFHATGAVANAQKIPRGGPSVLPHKEIEHSLSSSPLRQINSPQPLQRHRKNDLSTDTVPHQPIVKVVASRPPMLNHINTPLAASLTNDVDNISNGIVRKENDHDHETSSSSVGVSMAQLQNDEKENLSTRSFLRPLQSPCYFHRRFDDAVNIQKILEEITDDEWFSHSQLMQTATSVRDVSKQLHRRPIKCAVRNIMIVTKARDNGLVYLTRELTEWLLTTPRYGSDLGVNVYVDAKLQDSNRFDAAGLIAKDPRFTNMLKYWTPDLCWTSPEKFDLVLTLGGDGTVLFTSWLFQRIVPPILSFSLGSLGFLTNFEFTSYKEHLNTVMGDVGMRVNLRMRFTCTVFHSNQSQGAAPSDVEEGKRVEVLNELVIDRGPSPFVSNLEVYGDDELLTVVQADGCIFSTPTGSTAYSLSAGGSLIHPSIPGILLTPICPHTLSFRPMVLSDTLLLRVAVPASSRSSAYCSFDGRGRVELRQGDYVTVKASQYPFPTVVSGPGEWFESVRRALRWNVRTAQQSGWNGTVDGIEFPVGEEKEFDIDIDPIGTGHSEDRNGTLM